MTTTKIKHAPVVALNIKQCQFDLIEIGLIKFNEDTGKREGFAPLIIDLHECRESVQFFSMKSFVMRFGFILMGAYGADEKQRVQLKNAELIVFNNLIDVEDREHVHSIDPREVNDNKKDIIDETCVENEDDKNEGEMVAIQIQDDSPAGEIIIIEDCAPGVKVVRQGINDIDINNEIIQKDVVIDKVARSGTQLIEMNSSIIAQAGANSLSEIIAGGDVVIYGTAKGKIFAGNSKKESFVWCEKFNPELVSIGGLYHAQEEMPAEILGSSVMVTIRENKLFYEKKSLPPERLAASEEVTSLL